MAMRWSVVILLAELGVLSLLSRSLAQALFQLLSRLTRSRTLALTTLIILFFPGTVVHELAHLFVAEVLRVRTGKLTLVPESLEGEEVQTGAVAIAQTDPLRRTLIGLAPVYVGIGALGMLSYFIRHPPAGPQGDAVQNVLVPGVLYYFLFSISNSMFSSKEDMKGVVPFFLTVGIFAAAAYLAGFRVGIPGGILEGLRRMIDTILRTLGVVIGVNLAILAAASGLLAVSGRRKR